MPLAQHTHHIVGTAAAALIVAASGALGGGVAAAAGPGDTDVRECLDKGGAVTLEREGGRLTPVVKKVCTGGSLDGQPIG
ncbi:hypothetical protein BLA24_14525 [Streptomyces cinnamoneus]|uniref:DUF320 domain-containing protein n=1 Tax=Streptomyces cinnamoneus TaxID=53446 RepID=A0A2G1XIB9_STRCJ|nr:hypothetical protein [Streptomyces cinnamoneus]PHQ51002.1 hypothetical protein BLA24_14525 [Streptomyces cinnamoneus]PPT13776.1 hypothetical protein CYQ11_13550 [Streptomyces cinnamoneus]